MATGLEVTDIGAVLVFNAEQYPYSQAGDLSKSNNESDYLTSLEIVRHLLQ